MEYRLLAAADVGVDDFLPFFISSIEILYDMSDAFGIPSYFSNNNSNFWAISTNVGRLRESYCQFDKKKNRNEGKNIISQQLN